MLQYRYPCFLTFQNMVNAAAGYIGIQPEDCTGKGCCWKATQDAGTPWCYYRQPTSILPTYQLCDAQMTGMKSAHADFTPILQVRSRTASARSPLLCIYRLQCSLLSLYYTIECEQTTYVSKLLGFKLFLYAPTSPAVARYRVVCYKDTRW